MKILFVGGGSVGHIAPSVAVWDAVRLKRDDVQAHFVCSPRPDDAKFLRDNNLDHTVLDAPRASMSFPIRFLKAVKDAKRILEHQQPDVIFSKGSYISLPLCFAAKKKKVPIVMHESDSVSGYANRIVQRWASHTCTGFPTTDNRQPTTHTGNPIRPDVTQGSKEEALKITGLDDSKPILLIMGGSQGAQAINDAVGSMLEDLLLRCNTIHITGRGKGMGNLGNRELGNYYQTEFANEELKHFYAAADLAVSRAGAGSIAELAACSIPMILVPLRGVGHDHQYKNAVAAERAGGCKHLEQSDLEKKLLSTVHTLITDEGTLDEMSKKLVELAKPDAASQIAEIVLQTLDSTRGDE